jgi:hypothetical protein
VEAPKAQKVIEVQSTQAEDEEPPSVVVKQAEGEPASQQKAPKAAGKGSSIAAQLALTKGELPLVIPERLPRNKVTRAAVLLLSSRTMNTATATASHEGRNAPRAVPRRGREIRRLCVEGGPRCGA